MSFLMEAKSLDTKGDVIRTEAPVTVSLNELIRALVTILDPMSLEVPGRQVRLERFDESGLSLLFMHKLEFRPFYHEPDDHPGRLWWSYKFTSDETSEIYRVSLVLLTYTIAWGRAHPGTFGRMATYFGISQ